MISRQAEPRLKKLVAEFPAVLILGSRQCGKTTLAKHAVTGRYFDLERPSDRQVFAGDAEFALQRLPAPLVIDEAQGMPELFPVLRALIDEARGDRGRYILLGSVSPNLVKGISESLAGRVGILELTPFLFCEVAGRRGATLDNLWLRGGYPDAFLAGDAEGWRDWQENYLRTFIERDIARHRLLLSPVEIGRLMTMVAHCQGGILNASAFGRSLGHAYHTIQNVLDLLEGYFLVRRLPPYSANLGKRLVKAPKLYLRDSGLLHHLLGIDSKDGLLGSPARGNSFEGFMIEQMAALEGLRRPGSRLCYYRTHTGDEIDLIIDRGQTRIGCEFKAGASVGPSDWGHLQRGIAEGVIHRGIVVYAGERTFAASQAISVVSARELLAGKAADW